MGEPADRAGAVRVLQQYTCLNPLNVLVKPPELIGGCSKSAAHHDRSQKQNVSEQK